MNKNKILKLSKRKILRATDSHSAPRVIVMREIDSTNSFAKRLFLKNKIKNNTIIIRGI